MNVAYIAATANGREHVVFVADRKTATKAEVEF
jgi:hypothetical protein